MNIALILAGGIGQRLGEDIPKQFVDVFGKPLIVWTLEKYEQSPLIDAIEVVCVSDYIPKVWKYATDFNLTKLKWVVPGGCSCQESTKNGIFHLEGICNDDDVIIIGMSTQCFITDDIIKDSLDTCRKYGNAFAATWCIYNLAMTTDGFSSELLNRKEIHKTINMPWTAPFGTYLRNYKQAYREGIEIDASSYAPTLFLALGEKIYLSKDTAKNKIHVTTQDDLDIVKGCILLEEMRQRGEMS